MQLHDSVDDGVVAVLALVHSLTQQQQLNAVESLLADNKNRVCCPWHKIRKEFAL